MTKSRGILLELLVALPYAALKAGTKELVKRASELTKDETRYFVNKRTDRLQKDFKLSEGPGIALTNNEIKDPLKVIKSLENRRILLKVTTRKIATLKGGFLNFLRPLITAGLPLMKSVLTPLAKTVLLPFGLSAAMSATDETIQQKI